MVGGYLIYVLIQKLQFQKINFLLNQNILNLELLILDNLKIRILYLKQSNYEKIITDTIYSFQF